MAQDKMLVTMNAKLDALLEKAGLKPADFEEKATFTLTPRKLTKEEQQAIDNAPATPVGANGPQVAAARTDAATNAPVTPTVTDTQKSKDDAPWAGYENASTDSIVTRLRGMSNAERNKALQYERKNKNRVEITRVNWNS